MRPARNLGMVVAVLVAWLLTEAISLIRFKCNHGRSPITNAADCEIH